MAEELSKANLGHLAALKYREAVLFTPDDAALAARARLTQEEASRMRERMRAARAATARGSTAPAAADAPDSRHDEARETAANAYLLAARHGRFSEARLALRALGAVDRNGIERAKLADAFRQRADTLWAGDPTAARPLYQLTAELDASDTEAARRSQVPAAAATPAATGNAPPPAIPVAPTGRARKEIPTEMLPLSPRNPAASRAATRAGRAALARLSLPGGREGLLPGAAG